MANEVSHRHSATSDTLYFTIRNVSRQMWNTAGTPNFETLTVANWGDYDIALTESPASSYFYAGTFPPIAGNMIAGFYWVDVFEQAGGSPAISDTLVASYWGYWNGTTYKFWADDTTHVSGTLQAAGDIPTAVAAIPTNPMLDTEDGSSFTAIASVGAVAGSIGGNILGTVAAVVGSVGGNVVGSVVGNVDGNLGGSVGGSVSGDVLGSVGSVADSGASLTALGDARIANLDTAVSTVDGKVDTLLTRVTAAVYTAWTKLADAAIAGTETAGSLLKLVYDNLNATVGSRSSHSAADVRTAMEAEGSKLDTIYDAGLTQQVVRDAMKLAPSAGEPAAGSVDGHLDLAALEATLTVMKGAGFTDESLKKIYDSLPSSGGGGYVPQIKLSMHGASVDANGTIRGFILTTNTNGTPVNVDGGGVPSVTCYKPDGTSYATPTATLVAGLTGVYTFSKTPATTDQEGIYPVRATALIGTRTYTDVSAFAMESRARGIGLGEFSVTLQFYETGGTTPIAGTSVHVRGSSNALPNISEGSTDALGQFKPNVNAGTYKVTAADATHTFTVGTLVVAADGSATGTTIYGTPFTPTAPGTPDLCTIWGRVINASGTGVSGVTITAVLGGADYFVNQTNGQQVRQDLRSSTTDSDGDFEIQLIRAAKLTPTGAVYDFKIPPATNYEGYHNPQLSVPDAASANLFSLK